MHVYGTNFVMFDMHVLANNSCDTKTYEKQVFLSCTRKGRSAGVLHTVISNSQLCIHIAV